MSGRFPTVLPSRIARGQRLTASRLNQSRAWIDAFASGVAVPQQIDPVVHPQAMAVRWVIVRAIVHNDDSWLMVEEIRKHIINGEWDGTYLGAGTQEEMSVYPNQRAGDYVAFLWAVGRPLTENMNVLPALWDGTEWTVWQYHPFATKILPGGLLRTDCIPVAGGP